MAKMKKCEQAVVNLVTPGRVYRELSKNRQLPLLFEASGTAKQRVEAMLLKKTTTDDHRLSDSKKSNKSANIIKQKPFNRPGWINNHNHANLFCIMVLDEECIKTPQHLAFQAESILEELIAEAREARDDPAYQVANMLPELEFQAYSSISDKDLMWLISSSDRLAGARWELCNQVRQRQRPVISNKVMLEILEERTLLSFLEALPEL